jgi:DeoR/GlpR family transcriptional regulator of sugar metabolism
MLSSERRRRILEQARVQGVVSLRELAEQLDTSEVTVRRDLRALAAEGLLRRTHGGAVLPAGLGHEPSYSEKAGQAAAEKAAIAEIAAGLVQPGDSILLGPGTTTLALARLLVRFAELTVVTNSLLIAQVLTNAPDVEVVVTGGTLRRSIHAVVGPATEHSLRSLRVSQVFISGNGLSAERGLTTPNLLVAATDQALVATARQVIVLADSTKIGAETMCETVPCAGMDILITDSGADPEVLAQLRETGVDVRVAEVAGADRPGGSARLATG